MKVKTFTEWQNYLGENKKLCEIHSVHQSAFFHWCEKHVPYWPIPFVSKRTRVKIRWYFRHHWWNRVNRKMVNALKKISKGRGQEPMKYVIPDDLAFEWELVTKNKE